VSESVNVIAFEIGSINLIFLFFPFYYKLRIKLTTYRMSLTGFMTLPS